MWLSQSDGSALKERTRPVDSFWGNWQDGTISMVFPAVFPMMMLTLWPRQSAFEASCAPISHLRNPDSTLGSGARRRLSRIFERTKGLGFQLNDFVRNRSMAESTPCFLSLSNG